MKKENTNLKISELNKAFQNTDYVDKKDLRNFYFQYNPSLTDQDFRRVLYALEKEEVISSTGSGVFYFTGNENPPKKKYIPSPSQSLQDLNRTFKETFPYLKYLVWETRIFNEFMILQSGQNYIILDVEKGTEDSVFNRLSEPYSGKVFLNPTRQTIERYIQPLPEAILISALISQTPMGKNVQEIPYAPIEKILVDVLVDDKKFFAFRGNELVSIYNGLFNSYLIDEKSLFRYARRRKATDKLKKFVADKTQVKFYSQPGKK